MHKGRKYFIYIRGVHMDAFLRTTNYDKSGITVTYILLLQQKLLIFLETKALRYVHLLRYFSFDLIAIDKLHFSWLP